MCSLIAGMGHDVVPGAAAATDAATATATVEWWQCDDGRCAVVLHEVFAWLSGAELARCGAACRAWRRAAADPTLWRRLLRPPRGARGAWRRDYVALHAGWRLEARTAAGSAPLHAALSPGGTCLALVGEDSAAVLQLWAEECGAWHPTWSAALAARGWRGGVRAEWASSGGRLLVLGAPQLADSWELIVVNVDEECRGRVASRARCSAGAGGCWADAAGAAFLSLELRTLAPGVALTTVWLNAATQETQSEHAGVTAPLLHIYNENGAHITLATVVQVPSGGAADVDAEESDATLEVPRSSKRSVSVEIQTFDSIVRRRGRGVLVACSGCRAGAGGALSAWELGAPRPPSPVRAATRGDLRERLRRRRATVAIAPDAAPPAPPDEASVRALCSPPAAACALPAPPVGLVAAPSGRCVWVALGDGGAWCASLPALRPLRRLSATPAPHRPHPADLHYVQPAISELYFVSPSGARSGAVRVWSALYGAEGHAPPPHAAPALVVMLPPLRAGPAVLLVLAGDTLYVWRSRATPQPHMVDA